MCGRFNQKEMPQHYEAYNVGPGDGAYVLVYTPTGDIVKIIGRFGMKFDWSVKLHFNARAEGILDGTTKMFTPLLNKSRCIIPVTGFIEGPEKEKLQKPYLIHSTETDRLYLAGVSVTRQDGTVEFAIITTASSPITAAIGHHRCPVILPEDIAEDYLDPLRPLEDIYHMLQGMYYDEGMEAIPLKPELVRSGKNKTAEILTPAGHPIIV